ncbi:MAG: hypothetical protein AB8F95_10280 [Bacteroidia bacterium]
MKYWIIGILLFVLGLINLQAQAPVAKLYLKSGKVIEGTILEQGVGTGVTIRDYSGFVTHHEDKDIERVEQRALGGGNRLKVGINSRESGFYQRFSIGMGYTAKRGAWNGERILAVSPSIDAVSGWRFSPKINVGLGMGLTVYDEGYGFAPFYLDFRGDWDLPGTDNAVVPHYFVDLGYGAAFGNPWNVNMIEQRGGLYTNAGLGLKLRSRGRIEWTYTMGFRRQSTYQEYSLWRDENTIIRGNRIFQSLDFQLGVMF